MEILQPNAFNASPAWPISTGKCTIEEREEYEPPVAAGNLVFTRASITRRSSRAAETEADTIVWDGGNNDFPFIRPDLWITVADPLRAGHELTYHPGEVNVRRADVVLVNKVDAASPEDVRASSTT